MRYTLAICSCKLGWFASITSSAYANGDLLPCQRAATANGLGTMPFYSPKRAEITNQIR